MLSMTRRDFVPTLAGLGAVSAGATAQTVKLKGRIKQGATRGCFGKGMSMEDMCKHAANLGLKGIDLVGPDTFATLKKYGLVPTMVPGSMNLAGGCNRKEDHAQLLPKMREIIDLAAQAGAPNVIALSGNRRGMSDQEGMDNVVAFLDQIKKQAEDKGVTICLELLNSKVNHPDYMCDRTAWGVEACKRANSPRVKLLYDIYHMQIMEGDIIRTIRGNIQWIGHFHTAGNPGRHEPDDTQELNYRPIMQAIAELKYDGYVVHEYGPVRDALKSLEEAIRICDA
jgi:hydroxypyruvate isomerase